MFAIPTDLYADVFATLPDHLRIRDRCSPWLDRQLNGAQADSFLEGPSFDREGNLYVVDLPYGRILRVSADGDFEVFLEYDGEPNGLKIHRDGRIFVADFKRGILTIDPYTRSLEPLLSEGLDGPFLGVNDLHFADSGDLYFTDQGYTGHQDSSGCLYCLRADGSLARILSNVPSPNGLVVDEVRRTVYLSVTRANAVWRVPMGSDGEAFKVGTFIQLTGGVGPDGLAANRSGGLAVAHLGLGTVWIFDAHGEPRYRVRSPLGQLTTNVAFQGHWLYITESESGSILRAKVPTAGRPMYSHASHSQRSDRERGAEVRATSFRP